MHPHSALPWTLESIDLARVEVAKVRHNEALFFLICSSSFIESGSDLYTRNLVEFFTGDEEVRQWLREHWEPEELQHGRALAAYIRRVWPEFDWDAAFASFWEEYRATCTLDELEPTRGLELVARCVVETGTATMYRALHAISDEPVLREITNNIKSDEVRHYKYFYQYFRRYREQERLGRYQVFRALLRRVREIKGEDGDIALRHVYYHCYPQRRDDVAEFRRVAGRAEQLLRRHAPIEMTVKMLLKPIELPPRMQDALEKPLASLAAKLFLH
ncbi:ferritin-like domain-containing protein [Aerosticca soli]|jgi:hypothetical protein|uniref:Ferritin n=1 Tax=Aerosticca soli TaxID=2010829 RepID=A0A2Z6E8J9_9GAMM|nr:ferritin-like domain-containing protein [Aerosticca soli]MDI3263240.1 ferritin-like domain-containing protein [Fulvimonas sp.]BBD81142.1 hypothetical protein ALSL_2518 [Aerosticca soli]